jgi:hypothetical protein
MSRPWWLQLILALLVVGVARAAAETPIPSSKTRADLAPGLSPTAHIPGPAGSTLDRLRLGEQDPPSPSATGEISGGDGTWFEVAPPQRDQVFLIPDPARRRVLMASRSFGWSVDWALSLTDPLQWERVADQAPRGRPFELSAMVFDPHTGRWIAVGNDRGGRLATFMLDPSDSPRWTPLEPLADSVGLPRLYRPRAVFDSRRERLVLFSGERLDARDDPGPWILNLAEVSAWERPRVAGEAPSPRFGHSAAYDSVGDRLIVAGGAIVSVSEPWGTSYTGEVWAFDLAHFIWSRIEPAGEGPGPFFARASFVDPPTGDLLLFGLLDTLYHEIGDWRLQLHPEPRWWRMPIGGVSPGPCLPALSYETAADRFLCVPGGREPTDALNVFSLSMRPEAHWSALGHGVWPRARFGHASVLDAAGDRAMIFGGVGSWSNYLNEVWSVSLAAPDKWELITPKGEAPPPRHEPAGIYDPLRRRMVVFGGWTFESNFFDDVWELTMDGDPTWRRVQPEGDGPSGRRGHIAVLDPLRDRMIVFGGYDGTLYLNDTWALELAEPMRWQRLVTVGGPPPGRWEPDAAYDPARDRIVAHGGAAESRSLSDTWALSLRDLEWSGVETTNEGPRLARARAICDPVRDRTIGFGGFAVDIDLIIEGGPPRSLVPAPEPRWAFLRPEGFGEFKSASTVLYDPRRDRAFGFGGARFLSPSSEAWLLEFGKPTERHAWVTAAASQTDRVVVEWQSGFGRGALAQVERRGINGSWVALTTLLADDSGRWRLEDRDVRPGHRYLYRILLDGTPAPAEGQVSIEVPSAAAAELLGAIPNPAHRDALMLVFRIAKAGPIELDLFDLAGRRRWHGHFSLAAAQTHGVRVDAHLEPGLYLARLETRTGRFMRRVVVLP